LFLCETYLLLSTLQFWQVRVPSPKLKPADEKPKGVQPNKIYPYYTIMFDPMTEIQQEKVEMKLKMKRSPKNELVRLIHS
jgi:hypothetical protein